MLYKLYMLYPVMFSVHVAHKWLFISPDCHCPYHHIHHHCHHPHHIHHSSSASSFISSPSSSSFIYKEKMGMDMLGLSMTNKPIHLHHLLFYRDCHICRICHMVALSKLALTSLTYHLTCHDCRAKNHYKTCIDKWIH